MQLPPLPETAEEPDEEEGEYVEEQLTSSYFTEGEPRASARGHP